jgi:hypothetical protein
VCDLLPAPQLLAVAAAAVEAVTVIDPNNCLCDTESLCNRVCYESAPVDGTSRVKSMMDAGGLFFQKGYLCSMTAHVPRRSCAH